jgi:hypothetical protein
VGRRDSNPAVRIKSPEHDHPCSRPASGESGSRTRTGYPWPLSRRLPPPHRLASPGAEGAGFEPAQRSSRCTPFPTVLLDQPVAFHARRRAESNRQGLRSSRFERGAVTTSAGSSKCRAVVSLTGLEIPVRTHARSRTSIPGFVDLCLVRWTTWA